MSDLFDQASFWSEYSDYKAKFMPDICLKDFSAELFPLIDSTNSELLRRLASAASSGKVPGRQLVAAAEQSAGRGRVGRRFYSPENNGIYFSFCETPEGGLRDASFYTASAAVAVCRAVKNVCSKECGIKWVNDVYLDGKKVCGILAEGYMNPCTQSMDSIVVGIGINLRLDRSVFTTEALRNLGNAGGLESSTGAVEKISRTKLLAACICELFAIIDSEQPFMEEYRSRSILGGKTVQVTPLAGNSTQTYSAVVQGISDDAGLIVLTQDGTTKILRSGEVSLHGSAV